MFLPYASNYLSDLSLPLRRLIPSAPPPPPPPPFLHLFILPHRSCFWPLPSSVAVVVFYLSFNLLFLSFFLPFFLSIMTFTFLGSLNSRCFLFSFPSTVYSVLHLDLLDLRLSLGSAFSHSCHELSFRALVNNFPLFQLPLASAPTCRVVRPSP